MDACSSCCYGSVAFIPNEVPAHALPADLGNVAFILNEEVTSLTMPLKTAAVAPHGWHPRSSHL